MFDGSSCGNADGHHGPPEAAGEADQCAHSASLSLRWDACTRVPQCIYLFGSSFLRHMPPEAPRTPEQSQSSRPEPCRDPELAQADQSQQAHAEQQAPAQPAPRRRSKSRKRDLVEVDRLVVSARRGAQARHPHPGRPAQVSKRTRASRNLAAPPHRQSRAHHRGADRANLTSPGPVLAGGRASPRAGAAAGLLRTAGFAGRQAQGASAAGPTRLALAEGGGGTSQQAAQLTTWIPYTSNTRPAHSWFTHASYAARMACCHSPRRPHPRNCVFKSQ